MAIENYQWRGPYYRQLSIELLVTTQLYFIGQVCKNAETVASSEWQRGTDFINIAQF